MINVLDSWSVRRLRLLYWQSTVSNPNVPVDEKTPPTGLRGLLLAASIMDAADTAMRHKLIRMHKESCVLCVSATQIRAWMGAAAVPVSNPRRLVAIDSPVHAHQFDTRNTNARTASIIQVFELWQQSNDSTSDVCATYVRQCPPGHTANAFAAAASRRVAQKQIRK